MAKVKEEKWPLNSGDSTAIPTANRLDGTANVWSDIWKYRVPSGQAHILKASLTFSAYLYDLTNSAECGGGTCYIRIAVNDQSEADEKVVYGPVLYNVVKDFNDKTKIAKLGIADYLVEERFYIIIQVKDDAVVDESLSYFNLETIRVRSTV